MKTKRKISIRKILQVLLTITAAAGCIVAMVSASTIEGEKPLKSLPAVHIKNDRKYHFIEQKEIMDLAIYNRNIDILHTPVSRLDLRGIERAIKTDPWVAEAQVFIDIDRMMHIYVTQRVPIARIFRQDGTSYYMDSTLHTMPLSDNYTYYTMVVTNAPEMKRDSSGMVLRKQLATLVRAIQADSFWNAQVSQVIVDSVGMFEMMTVIGNQRILFGDTSRMKEKFTNLVAFYRNVLNRIGWDKYETLDVRFNGQVVAAPSLPYKGPVDKAIAKMNWITSIEVTEAQKLREDSLRKALEKVAAVTKVSAPVKTTQKAIGKEKELAGAKQAMKKPGKVVAGAKQASSQKVAVKPATAGKADLKKQDVKDNSKSKAAKAAPGKKDIAKGTDPHPNKEMKAMAKSKTSKDKKALAKPAATPTLKKAASTKAAKNKKEAKNNKQGKAAADKKNVKKKDDKNKGKSQDKKGKAAKYTYPENKGH